MTSCLLIQVATSIPLCTPYIYLHLTVRASYCVSGVTSKMDEWKARGYEARVPSSTSRAGSRGCPWTSLRLWKAPVERARLSRAASKEYARAHATTLMAKRIDKESRKKGKYLLMERELYHLFKERRAHGRKVSARWLSAVGKLLMKKLYPEQVRLLYACTVCCVSACN